MASGKPNKYLRIATFSLWESRDRDGDILFMLIPGFEVPGQGQLRQATAEQRNWMGCGPRNLGVRRQRGRNPES